MNLVGFGTFEKTISKPRICTNPKTGEKIKVGERVVIKFRPSKYFKDLLASSVK